MVDDRLLVARVLQGDMQAFTALIRQHQRLVDHMISRVVKRQEDREELCQDVFLKVLDKLGDFNFESKLSTWIATIAYRHALNYLRVRKLEFAELSDASEADYNFFVAEASADTLETEDITAYILQLADQLPVQYKTILLLYHVEQMSYSEICAVTSLPEGTVKNYLFRARTLMKEKVKQHIKKDEWL